MGLHKLPYWTATIAFDLCMFFIPVGIFLITVAALGSDADFISASLSDLIALMFTFACAFLALSYAFSFIFEKAQSAYRWFPLINFFFFWVVPLVISAIDANSDAYNDFMNTFIPLVSPFLTLFLALLWNNTYFETGYNFSQYVYILFGQFILFAIITAIRAYYKTILLPDQTAIEDDGQPESDDQIEERQRLGELGGRTVPILVDGLSKMYPNKMVAIRNNTFTVQPGEIFGLLGPNGAGKSTTFNILTAAISKTSGSAKLEGIEIGQGVNQMFRNVGVCPQANAVYPHLTVWDHLTYFARVKGVKGQDKAKLVDYYLRVMQLTEYKHKQAEKLSGGNMRKLCVAMALMGNPELMFFDEPSSGLDPIARRYLWQAINQSIRHVGSSIILTTHSMHEAESLSTRLGILVKGRFACIGSPTALKKKYGEGYTVNVTLAPGAA